MSKHKQEAVDETEILRHTVLCSPNHDEHLREELEEAKASSRRASLVALSKVVNKAFTGWTIKTQR